MKFLPNFHILILIAFARWFIHTAEVYSLIILIHTICSILFLTCIIFQLDLVSKSKKFEINFAHFIALFYKEIDYEFPIGWM